MEEKIIKITGIGPDERQMVLLNSPEESKKLIHEVAEKCRILPSLPAKQRKSKYVQRWT